MRIAFLILVSVHGLIHVLGFVKAFGLSEIKALTQPIAKPLGIVWMFAAILFGVAAIMFAFKNSSWWSFGLLAAVVSQVLIILFWQDARFGSIANGIVLIASIIGYGTWSYHRAYQENVLDALKQDLSSAESPLTGADIQDLPEPVQRYVRYSGSVGKPKVRNFRIRFTGQIRKNEQSEWMPFTSEQYNVMQKPTRLFFMNAVMKHLPVAGYHCFRNGTAFMDIRLLSLFKVQYLSGGEMDTAETVTFFNDMCCMAPATLIDKRIKWLEVEHNKVKAEFTNNAITISAWLHFNDIGELINFISDDRYAADAGKKLRWATPLKEYKDIDGYRLAGYAEAIYSYPEGDVCYGTFRLRHIEYNCRDSNAVTQM